MVHMMDKWAKLDLRWTKLIFEWLRTTLEAGLFRNEKLPNFNLLISALLSVRLETILVLIMAPTGESILLY